MTKRVFIYDGEKIAPVSAQKFEDIYLGRMASQKHANQVVWMITQEINGKREIKPVLFSHRGYARWDLLLDSPTTPAERLAGRIFDEPISDSEKHWQEAVKNPIGIQLIEDLIKVFDIRKQTRKTIA